MNLGVTILNHSLAKFSKVVRGLWISGLCIWLIAILINIAIGRGLAESNQGAFAFGYFSGPLLNWLFSLGAALFGLSIFGAFLRITAKSIVEGLGGNVNAIPSTKQTQGPLVGWERAQPTGSVANSGGSSPSVVEEISEYAKEPLDWARRNLSSSNFEWWDEYGNPDLTKWISAGKPDFKAWMKISKL